MRSEQFLVYEHLSYEMVATALHYIQSYEFKLHECMRMFEAIEYVITPKNCRIRIFPDWQFSDFALDNHHED
ncbi:MAG: hypothetical protein IPP74_15110 [Alphaproteobacteria bacterium]|nr:hypothetical protein [Alphaproteobacteria bacterium]